MAGGKLTCPNCGAEVHATDDRCMACGAVLDAGHLVAPPPPELPPAPRQSAAPNRRPVAETDEKHATTGGEEVVWHYQLGGRDLGPVSWAEIEEMFADTADAEHLLVAREGDEAWRPAADAIEERARAEAAARHPEADDLVVTGLPGEWTAAEVLDELEEAEPAAGGEAEGAPDASAPASRRPIGVAIVAVLFGLPALLAIIPVALLLLLPEAGAGAPAGPEWLPGLAVIGVPILKAADALYKGYNWARLVFMALLGLLALGGIYFLLQMTESPGPPAVGIALCVVLFLALNARGAREYCSR